MLAARVQVYRESGVELQQPHLHGYFNLNVLYLGFLWGGGEEEGDNSEDIPLVVKANHLQIKSQDNYQLLHKLNTAASP